jgi:hypothetical protein
VYLLYKPTGACWYFLYESLARGLYAPGDPADADCVFSGTTWGSRLTVANLQTARPAESVSARLAAMVAVMNTGGFVLPNVQSRIATQAQAVAAVVPGNNVQGTTPPILQMIRDAAANGIAWLAADAGATGPGTLIFNYARWETMNPRVLDRSQVLAGPAVTASTGWYVGNVDFSASKAGAQTTWIVWGPSTVGQWGVQGPSGLRIWGDVQNASGVVGPENAAVQATGYQLCTDRHDPTERLLDSIDVYAGVHRTPTGVLSPTQWDPYAHHFAPIDVASIVDSTGATKKYWVTQSAHRLTATVWQTTHTLDKFTQATALP